MSAHVRLPRKSASSMLSYATAHTSSSESDDGDGASGGGAARGRDGRGPSKRAKGTAKAVEGDDEEESDEGEAPRKKARKAAKGAGKGRKKGEGRLEVLKTLPVELLVEIVPNDLLALSMVNKQYRALLVAKSSARLWKNARERLEIPAVTSGDYQEWQYASLIFGIRCQACGSGKGVCVLPGLRLRLCNACSTPRLVRPPALERTHPKDAAKLHPRAFEIVLSTYKDVLLDDLYRATASLRDLEDQDEDSDIAEGRLEREPAQASTSATSFPFGRHSRSSARRDRSSVRRPRRFTSKQWSSRQDESSDDDGDAPSPYSHRVDEYVALRRKAVDLLKKDEDNIRHAYWYAKDHLTKVKTAVERANTSWVAGSRAVVLKDKVMALDLGYTHGDFYGSWRTSKLVTAGDANITEEEWATLKPKLLKLLDREQAKALEANQSKNQSARQSARQSALRPHYDRLKASLPESARPYLPLFVDFLLLPSVKTLWENDEDEDDTQSTAWDDKLDEIREELEQFRIDLVVHPRQCALEATTDPDKCGANDDNGYGALGADGDDLDAFFARATSFVCCDAKDCRVRRQRRTWRIVNGHFVSLDPPPLPDPRPGAIGPLEGVLAHLHAQHNSADVVPEKRRAKGEPQFHIALPLEVACAVGALLEVNELDAATAGVKELDHTDLAVKAYEWENRTSSHRRFAAADGRRAWFDLLFTIKSQGAKLARMKPPLFLDPPVIVLHKLKHPRVGYGDAAADGARGAAEDEDEDEDEEEMSVMSGEESE